MRRLSKTPFLLFAVVTLLISCGATGTGASVSVMTFSPNPATLAAGMCESEVSVVSTSGGSVTLVALSAIFEDANATEVAVDFTDVELADQMESIEVPAKGVAQGTLRFDLSGSALEPPLSGEVVITGVGISGAVQFVGSLECNEP